MKQCQVLFLVAITCLIGALNAQTCSLACGSGSYCYIVPAGSTVSGLVGSNCLNTFTAYNPSINLANGYPIYAGQQVCLPTSTTCATGATGATGAAGTTGTTSATSLACGCGYGSTCYTVQAGNTVSGLVGSGCLSTFTAYNPTINANNGYPIAAGQQVCLPNSCISSTGLGCGCGYGSTCYTVQAGNTVSGLVGSGCLSSFTSYNPNINVNNGYALTAGQQVCLPTSCTYGPASTSTCSNAGYYGYNSGSYVSSATCGSCASGTCYTVRAGDTVNNLVGGNQACVYSVAQANSLANVNNIVVGQSLCIPSGCNAYTSSLNYYNNGAYYNGGSNSVACSGTVVTVQCGNTVGGFVGQNQACINSVAQANGLSNPNYITAGQSLCIPAGCNGYYSNFGYNTNQCGLVGSYTVQSGQTCSSIASAYGITLAQLYACNPEINSGCNNLLPGQVLTV